MNAPCCCRSATPGDDDARRLRSPRWRRTGEIAGWLVPGATLALMPKCPACVAGYVALATGIGVSIPAATNVRLLLIVLCAASLTLLAVWRAYRLIAPKTFTKGN